MNMKLNYMKNNFTTFEQSKRLIELGVPVDFNEIDFSKLEE